MFTKEHIHQILLGQEVHLMLFVIQFHGRKVFGSDHLIKGAQYMRAFSNWLRANPNASYYDKVVAKSLLFDLKNALKGN